MHPERRGKSVGLFDCARNVTFPKKLPSCVVGHLSIIGYSLSAPCSSLPTGYVLQRGQVSWPCSSFSVLGSEPLKGLWVGGVQDTARQSSHTWSAGGWREGSPMRGEDPCLDHTHTQASRGGNGQEVTEVIGQDNCVRVWATFKAPLGEIESARWGPRGTVALVLPGGGTLGHQCGGTKDGLVMVGSLVHIEGAGVEEAGRAQGSWAQVDSGPLGRAGLGRGSSKRRWDSVGLHLWGQRTPVPAHLWSQSVLSAGAARTNRARAHWTVRTLHSPLLVP